MDEEDTPAGAQGSESDPSDDQILAEMAAARQTKADDELLGSEDEPSDPAGKGKGKTPDDDGDDEEDEGDQADDEDEDEDEDGAEEGKPVKRSLDRARKLFAKGDVKGALKLALGLKDEDLNGEGEWDNPKFANAKFRAFRAKVEREREAAAERDRKQTEREQNFELWLKNDLGPRLQPAVKVLQLQKQYKETGDVALIVELVEELSGESYDVVQKKVLRGEKTDPTSRRLLRELEELKAKLNEQKPKEPTEEEKRAQAQQQLREYLGEIKEEIADHEVKKIPGAAKKVLAVLRRHYDPKLKAPRISIEDAADRVVRQHKRLLRGLLPEAEKRQPAESTPPKVKAHARSETREAGVPDEDLSDDEILRQMEIEMAKKRRDERQKAGKR